MIIWCKKCVKPIKVHQSYNECCVDCATVTTIQKVPDCTRCKNLGYTSEPYTHPTSPMLDGWIRTNCDCAWSRIRVYE